MIEIWPPKIGLQNQKSIWRGVASVKDKVKFDGLTTIAAVQIFPRMMVRYPSILSS